MANFRDRPLIEYLPDVIKDVREYKTLIEAEQPEIFNLFEEIQKALNNQFVETSDEYGVKRWETLLKIIPKATSTLEERKFAILARLIEQLPFTYRVLEQMLTDLCGEDNFEIIFEPNIYSLKVRLMLFSSKNADAVSDLLRRVIPANLAYIISNDTVRMVELHYLGAALQSTTHHLTCHVDLTRTFDDVTINGKLYSGGAMVETKRHISPKINISI